MYGDCQQSFTGILVSKIRYAIGALAISGIGLVGIANYEGFRSEAYNPSGNQWIDRWTIGFGSTTNVKKGDKITVPQGLERLLRDSATAEAGVKRCIHVPLSQGEYDAFASLSFNIGVTNFCNSSIPKLLNREKPDYAGACEAIKKFNKVKYRKSDGTIAYRELEGLTRRRNKEYQMCIQR